MIRHPRRIQVYERTGYRQPRETGTPRLSSTGRLIVFPMETPRPQYSLFSGRYPGYRLRTNTLKAPSAFPCCRTVAWLDGLFDEHLFTVAGAAHVLPAIAEASCFPFNVISERCAAPEYLDYSQVEPSISLSIIREWLLSGFSWQKHGI